MVWRRILLAASSAGFALLAIEIGLRALVVPAPNSAGNVLGSDLPPIRLIPAQPSVQQPRAGRRVRIRRDDLAGMMREDPVIGYAPRERATSRNGWWQSNNVGARARHDTAAEPLPGTTRVLVFGDSFAGGSRVLQDQAWPAVLEASAPGLEVVNLGVDGYSAGQSLLRYRALRDGLHPGIVLLTVSPRADFWRDVNTLRTLAGWRSWTVMPRFVLEDGELRLVPSPYPAPSAIYADNRDGPSARLRDHLARYDRFYVPWMYTEPAGLAGRSLLVRFLLARWHTVLQRRTHEAALAPDGEAVAVTTRIAASMCAESAARGASFLLLLLPSERDLGHLRRRAAYREQWEAIAAAFTRAGVPTIDLATDLLAAPAEDLDRGYDGTHHGPRANHLIAAAVARALTTLERTSPTACGGPAA
jgi:hypothetical protein